MIPNIVTNARLDEALQNLIVKPTFYYREVQEFFMDMYNTGCRSNEMLFAERWKVEGNDIILTTFKTQKKRYFKTDDLSSNFRLCIEHGRAPYGGLSEHQILAEFKKHFELINLHCGKKATQLYAFRYNRARIEFERLKDVSLVMEYMGWDNPQVAAGYLHNTLNENRGIKYKA
jgi:hypothetical protein